jgi:hypothetical protein
LGGKLKGCDIGYGLAASSCEGVDNVDACTVTAPDAIAAFAVPNPNGTSQPLSVFSGSAAQRVAPPGGSPSLLWTGDCLFSPTLSTVDAPDTNTEPITVNAREWCNTKLLQVPAARNVGQFFHRDFHTDDESEPDTRQADRRNALAIEPEWMYSKAARFVCKSIWSPW